MLETAPIDSLHAGTVVAPHNPVEGDECSEPRPDWCSCGRVTTSTRSPTPCVPEVWVVDVNAEVVHVATPAGRRAVARGASLAPGVFPDLVLEVAAIVG